MIARTIAASVVLFLPFAAAGQEIPPGKGAPPNGVYGCVFALEGGGSRPAGKLEIKDQTYRGIGEVSVLKYSSFAIGAEQALGFTEAGLNLPPIWKLRTARFVGNDAGGKPLVKIFYHPYPNTTLAIDCTMP
jgi:hypothetical protein